MNYCTDCKETFDTPNTETWSDPGDYPSNAGQFPLPDYDYDVCPHCGSTDFRAFDEDADKEDLVERYAETLLTFDYDQIKKMYDALEAEFTKKTKQLKELQNDKQRN